MLKKITWHIELALLRRRMRGLHDGLPPEEFESSGIAPVTELPSSGQAQFRETTAFGDLQ